MLLEDQQVVDAFDAAGADDEFARGLCDLEHHPGAFQLFHQFDDAPPLQVLRAEDHLIDTVLADLPSDHLLPIRSVDLRSGHLFLSPQAEVCLPQQRKGMRGLLLATDGKNTLAVKRAQAERLHPGHVQDESVARKPATIWTPATKADVLMANCQNCPSLSRRLTTTTMTKASRPPVKTCLIRTGRSYAAHQPEGQ